MRSCALFLFSALVGPVFANDGSLTLGGSPQLLSSHPTVRMKSEVITFMIREGQLMADCNFTFVNDGKACEVRMGFPDQGFGEKDPLVESGVDWKDWKPVSVFDSFLSWVDGKPAKTTLVKGKVEGEVFHTKTVKFPAKATVKVRDLYLANEGVQVTDDGKVVVKTAGYILSTGASWKGNIGSTTVIFDFDPKHPIKEMQFGTAAQILKMNFQKTFKNPKQAVRCTGPVKPVLKDNKLTYTIKNWRPTKASNIILEYAAGFEQQ